MQNSLQHPLGKGKTQPITFYLLASIRLAREQVEMGSEHPGVPAKAPISPDSSYC